MRSVFIILLAFFGLLDKAFCDAGHCVKYYVEIQLVDGRNLSGFVYVGGYEKRFEFKDISFLDYYNRNNPADTLHVYNNIRQLKFPTSNYQSERCQFHFEAASADNERKLLKKDIQAIKVVSYTVCNNCDLADKENGYYWNGIYPTVITELTKAEIDLLQTEPIAAINFGHDIKYNTDLYWMLSYSSAYQLTDLEKMRKEFKAEADELLKENKWDIVQSKYKVLKTELRMKGVIIFKIGEAL